MKIAEIFFSLQGEGLHAGSPTVFVRTAGCRVRTCSMHPANDNTCDTDWSMTRAVPVDKIAAEVAQLSTPHSWVCITGGEPMEQLPEVEMLRRYLPHLRFSLQTSGTIAVPPRLFDWVVVSPKVSRSDELVVRSGHEMKMVYRGQPDHLLLELQQSTRFHHYYLQPHWTVGGTNVAETIATVHRLSQRAPWSLTTQNHKWWGLR